MALIKLHVSHLSTQHINELREWGILSLQSDSWVNSLPKKKGLKDLLLVGTRYSSLQSTIATKVISFSISERLQPNPSARKYFDLFFQKAFSSVSSSDIKNHKEVFYVVNFLPYNFARSKADKIIQGLQDALSLSKGLNIPSINVVFMVQNAITFLESTSYRNFVDSTDFKVKISLISYRESMRCTGISQNRYCFDRSYFYNIIKKTDKELYYNLVYKTNSHIGHFILDRAHVRTHYDLTDFVRNNYVYESLYHEFQSLSGDNERILLLYTGLEKPTLETICAELRTLNTKYVDHGDIDYFSNKYEEQEIDCCYIITDIVCSGNTLERGISKIRDILGANCKIVLFTVLKMKNSPSMILNFKVNSLIEMSRGYYKTDSGECILCQIKQPHVEVNNVFDFRKIACNKLTPYDFWEIVHDCDALLKRQKDSLGRILEFRIETTKIFKRYHHWFEKLISAQFEDKCSEEPTIILTVREGGGIEFAKLVCKALLVSDRQIITISREDLSRPRNLADDEFRKKSLGQRILIVDDGINEGKTIYSLINYCNSAGANPIGVFVFDNRLNDNELRKLRLKIDSGPVMYLYRWPVAPQHFSAIQ